MIQCHTCPFVEKLKRRINELETQLDVNKKEKEQLCAIWGTAVEVLKIENAKWSSVFSKNELLERLGEEDFRSEVFSLPEKLATEQYNTNILFQEADARLRTPRAHDHSRTPSNKRGKNKCMN